MGIGVAQALPALPVRARCAAGTFIPDLLESEALRQLASVAIDAAQRAGADAADIRVASRRGFEISLPSPFHPDSALTFDDAYGLRVWVNGTPVFVGGITLTSDGVTQAARNAVATARALSHIFPRRVSGSPGPALTGEWSTPPVAIDPFRVSPDDHVALMQAFAQTAQRVPGALLSQSLSWAKETRVFASSHGALLTQYVTMGKPFGSIAVGERLPDRPVDLYIPGFMMGTGGFELVTGPALQAQIPEVAEQARELSLLPMTTVDVGRYDMVLDGRSFANTLGATLIPALDLDRALGDDADAEGTSFLSPPSAMLDQLMCSPALTVTADRGRPHVGQVKWDDEGVLAERFSVIAQGHVRNYFATRAAAATLAEQLLARDSLSTHGSAVAWSPQHAPIGAPTVLTVTPAADAPLKTLLQHMTNGLVLRNAGNVRTDQQLTNGFVAWPQVFEVKHGLIRRRIMNARIEFTSRRFWKDLVRVGDASTSETLLRQTFGSVPWVATQTTIDAPAGLFQDVDVLQAPRRHA